MSTLCFYVQFTKNKVGVNSLSVTFDVERITRSDGTRSALVTGGASSITIGRRGLYGYVLTGADLTLYDYVATAISTDSTLDSQEVPCLWTLWSVSWHDVATSILTIVGSYGKLIVDNINDTISSRLSTSSYTAPDNTGIANAETASVSVDGKLTTLRAGNLDNLDATVSSRSTLTASDVWSYVRRILTGFIVSSDSTPTTTSELTLYNFTDNTKTITNVSNETDIFFTIKGSKKVSDSHSLIQITKLAGLKYINKIPIASATGLTSADGSLSVDVDGNMTVAISAGAMALLDGAESLYGDVKTKNATGDISLVTTFSANILDTVTHTI